jgi:hypothetical protein
VAPVGGTVKSRLFASIAVGAAIVLGTSGCAFITPQSTEGPYSPADGINVRDVEGAPLQVRNALLVANADGTTGNMIAAVINMTDSSHTLTIQVGEGSSAVTETLEVQAHSVSSLGENVDPIRFDGIDAKPGSTVPIYFQSGDVDGALMDVPVLGGNDEMYQEFVPKPMPTPEPTDTLDGATPSPTPTP